MEYKIDLLITWQSCAHPKALGWMSPRAVMATSLISPSDRTRGTTLWNRLRALSEWETRLPIPSNTVLQWQIHVISTMRTKYRLWKQTKFHLPTVIITYRLSGVYGICSLEYMELFNWYSRYKYKYSCMLYQGLCTYLSPEVDMRDAWRLVEGGAVHDTNMR